MALHRRQFLQYGLYGGAALALRSIVSGIPASILLNPCQGLAQAAERAASVSRPTFLIYATSQGGDPVNCNVPGTYEDPTLYHAPDPLMAATSFNLGSQQVTGAKIWSTLDATALPNTNFFHHATYTSVHPDETKVLSVMGRTAKNEMLVSTIGRELQASLGTIQAAPISVCGSSSGETIYFGGAPQHIYSPSQLASVFGTISLGPNKLQALRDETVDALNAHVRSNGTPSQQSFIDNYVRSQQQAREVPDALLSSLAALKDATVASQVQAALTLFQMRITPAVTIHVPFGGDNHVDPSLVTEVAQHVTGVANLNTMVASIRAANMQDQVTFSMQNVFGRTMSATPINGRSHNSRHHVSVMIGPNIQGGVVGGVAKTGNLGYMAQAIDSTSGVGGTSGDIGYADTFSAQAKTLLAVTGVPEANIDSLVTGGSIVKSAVKFAT